ETIGQVVDNDRQFAWAWMSASYSLTVGGLMGPRDAYGSFFSSRHMGVVQFCFADGSVRGVQRGSTHQAVPPSSPATNDWFVLQQLGGMRDGGTMDTSAIMP